MYLVPFAMIPSSPIELGAMRNKKTVHIIAVDEFERGILQPEIAFRHAVQAVRILFKETFDLAPSPSVIGPLKRNSSRIAGMVRALPRLTDVLIT